ncbi:MAG TPA: TIGR01777 family oxidoreductase [Acidimicrobiales bacterium]
MEIVVTGSSGLIGTALVGGLEADGHRVRRLVRRPARGSGEVRWDPSAGEIDRDGLEGVDGVVHLAGPGIGDKRWSEARKHDLREARVVGTTLLADTLAGLDAKPPVLVSGSAIGYYGDRGDEKLTEQSKAGDDFLADLCRDWEGAAAPAAAAGIRVATIRTGIVLAPGGGALEKLLPLFKLGLGGRLGSGRQYWSWITIDDEVRAIRHLLEHDVSGPVNLTAPEPATNQEITSTLGEVLNRPTLFPVPRFGPKLILGGEATETFLYASQRVYPTVLEADGFGFTHPELESALRAVLDR